MLNYIVLQARLVRDPELRRLPSGKSVASVSVACDRDFTKEGGEKETDFIDIVAFGGTADHLAKWFTKGKMIIVSGRLQIRNWTDKDGNKRRSAEVVADSVYFGDSKKSDQGSYTTTATNGAQGNAGDFPETMAIINQYQAQNAQQNDFAMLDDDDAQLPF
jgi:single-strand DNA-binding protein